ncbi:MAG: YusW family protein [Solibacillus sp.]
MKKYFLLTTSLSFLLLAACSSDEVTNVPDNAPTEQNNASTETTSTNELFNFTKFNVDVSYDGQKSFDAEYENEPSGVEAKIEDDLTNEVLNGDAAYTKLEPIFKSFTFTSATPDEEIAQQVLQGFNLPDNYVEFEIDIEFTDGVKKEFTLRK